MKNTNRILALLLALSAGSACATTVRIHYDAGAETIHVRGDKGPMSWSDGPAAERGVDGAWSYSWPDALGDVQMKPSLGSGRLSVGGTYSVPAGATLDIYPFFGAPFGKVSVVDGIDSPQLQNKRALRIYLPPSYEENRRKRYPVIYMHDGQNLFDARTAAYGEEWRIDETINRLVATGQMEEVIVVGIDNTSERIAEYTPCCDGKYGGGRLPAYTRFITDTVKPYVDAHYRTLGDRAHTAIMGSSLGGLASVLIAQQRQDVFGMAASLSGSFWWDGRSATRSVAARVPVKFYLDAGTRDDGLDDTRLMRDALAARGYAEGTDLYFHVAEGAAHNEKSWAARVDKPLRWFFPWSPVAFPQPGSGTGGF